MSQQLSFPSLDAWLSTTQKPVLIAGPCSVESPEQVLTTAQQIKANTAAVALRGGIWKPRTRPNSFEGIGNEGLAWLKAAGDAVGLPVMTEVATKDHVKAALDAGIDMLWIGARTTVNPFSVQEIADVLQGIDIPVFVKNPINPDVQLWIGAIERLHRAGIKRMAAIHRGFSSFEKTQYRNAPMWELAIELKTQFPTLPLICDPSHIAGKRDLLAEIAQQALDLNMDGLILESHYKPDEAKSDVAQQVTPARLGEIITNLTVRQENSASPLFVNQLERLRKSIDAIDKELLEKIAERMALVDNIGAYKFENNVTVLQLERWKEIIETRTQFATKIGLDTPFITAILQAIHQESIRLQTKKMEDLSGLKNDLQAKK